MFSSSLTVFSIMASEYFDYPLLKFLNKFPLHTYPPITVAPRRPLQGPTLWIAPPRAWSAYQTANPDILSTDVECLKWQTHLALRGLKNIALRWDISPDGGFDGRLPCLHVPAVGDASAELLAPRFIPRWVDGQTGSWNDPLNGYRDRSLKDESNAWISLLEGVVHTALVRALHFCLYFNVHTLTVAARLFHNNNHPSFFSF